MKRDGDDDDGRHGHNEYPGHDHDHDQDHYHGDDCEDGVGGDDEDSNTDDGILLKSIPEAHSLSLSVYLSPSLVEKKKEGEGELFFFFSKEGRRGKA